MLIICILLGLATFLLMEAVAWIVHKYVMHGFLWHLHSDHHRKDDGRFFEKNDYFFLIFATPGILLFLLGTLQDNAYFISIATGITLYGLCYFLVHDIFIHQRFRMFRNSDNVYLRAIRKAHKVHHKHLGKEDGECFGMLIVPFKYLMEARASRRKSKNSRSCSHTPTS
jgi:beta-carotene 3-hydroxylase